MRSSAARALLAEAQAFDSLLMADAKTPADDRLAATIIARTTPSYAVAAQGSTSPAGTGHSRT